MKGVNPIVFKKMEIYLCNGNSQHDVILFNGLTIDKDTLYVTTTIDPF